VTLTSIAVCDLQDYEAEWLNEAAMIFQSTGLEGVRLIDLEPARDERGFFARTFCVEEFRAQGLETRFVQHSVSFTVRRGSIRGMHFQRAPHEEVKLLTCIRGAIHDVLIDLRPQSSSYLRWESYRLTAESRRQLYVPAGLAHGFQTLADDTEVAYLISAFYAPAAAAGIRHDDPAFGISWPLLVADMSARDRGWPDFATPPGPGTGSAISQ
jgi:dTDP-4-dehydrorhamnose 3,5-epimerase